MLSGTVTNSYGSQNQFVRQESSGFHDVLVSLLLGRGFAFGRLPEGTVEAASAVLFGLHLNGQN